MTFPIGRFRSQLVNKESESLCVEVLAGQHHHPGLRFSPHLGQSTRNVDLALQNSANECELNIFRTKFCEQVDDRLLPKVGGEGHRGALGRILAPHLLDDQFGMVRHQTPDVLQIV